MLNGLLECLCWLAGWFKHDEHRAKLTQIGLSGARSISVNNLSIHLSIPFLACDEWSKQLFMVVGSLSLFLYFILYFLARRRRRLSLFLSPQPVAATVEKSSNRSNSDSSFIASLFATSPRATLASLARSRSLSLSPSLSTFASPSPKNPAFV